MLVDKALNERAGTRKVWVQHPVFLSLALIAVIIFAAHFLRVRNFGMYLDEYLFIGAWMDAEPQQIVNNFQTVFVRLPQGRPLLFSIPQALAASITPQFGIQGLYVIGYSIVVITAGAMMLFVRRLSGSLRAGVVAALIYVLLPADTTHALNIHTIGIQPGMLLLTLAAWAYIDDRRVLAYLLLVPILFLYESPFTVFFVVPFLKKNWRWRDLLVNAAIILTALALVYLLRQSVADPRVTALNFSVAAQRSVIATGWGALLSLSAYPRAFNSVLNSLRPDTLLAVGATFAILVVAFTALKRERVPIRLLWVGVLALGCSYLLSFTRFPPTLNSGVSTSQHIAGGFGMALIGASLWSLFPSRLILAGFLALLVGYGVVIQREYVLSWNDQREFWQAIFPLIQDADDSTIVLVDAENLRFTRDIQSHGFHSAFVFESSFSIPDDWTNPPHVLLTSSVRNFQVVPRQTQWVVRYGAWEFPIQNGNVIYIDYEDGRFARRTESTVQVSGFSLRTKIPGAAISLPTRPLYSLLME